jgi:hypothetical protein
MALTTFTAHFPQALPNTPELFQDYFLVPKSYHRHKMAPGSQSHLQLCMVHETYDLSSDLEPGRMFRVHMFTTLSASFLQGFLDFNT